MKSVKRLGYWSEYRQETLTWCASRTEIDKTFVRLKVSVTIYRFLLCIWYDHTLAVTQLPLELLTIPLCEQLNIQRLEHRVQTVL